MCETKVNESNLVNAESNRVTQGNVVTLNLTCFKMGNVSRFFIKKKIKKKINFYPFIFAMHSNLQHTVGNLPRNLLLLITAEYSAFLLNV